MAYHKLVKRMWVCIGNWMPRIHTSETALDLLFLRDVIHKRVRAQKKGRPCCSHRPCILLFFFSHEKMFGDLAQGKWLGKVHTQKKQFPNVDFNLKENDSHLQVSDFCTQTHTRTRTRTRTRSLTFHMRVWFLEFVTPKKNSSAFSYSLTSLNSSSRMLCYLTSNGPNHCNK